MNDQDYIRKAVELAESIWPWDYYKGFLDESANLNQIEKDGLAAQLVRQVDALDQIAVLPDKIMTRVWSDKTGECLSEVRSPDRTMNAIKAIVDSEVLSQ